MIKHSIAFALAAATAISGPAAFATTQENTVAVDYSDINLNSDKGRQTLERRLDNAARDVCGMDLHATDSRIVDSQSRHCYKITRQELSRQLAEIISHSRSGG